MARSRLHRRYVKNPGLKHNPPLVTDILEFVVPGFGGFAGTRFLTRIATTQVAQRAPSWAKHAGAIASVGSFFAAWLLAHKWEWLKKYHTPIVVGSAIAALQSLIQIYIPILGWMVSDATPELATSATQGNLTAQDKQLAQLQLQPTDEDPNEFQYNDAYDAGRYSGPQGRVSMKTGAMPPATGPGGPAPQPTQGDDASDLAIDEALGHANLGVFANN
jgi:hypothetical protein